MNPLLWWGGWVAELSSLGNDLIISVFCGRITLVMQFPIWSQSLCSLVILTLKTGHSHLRKEQSGSIRNLIFVWETAARETAAISRRQINPKDSWSPWFFSYEPLFPASQARLIYSCIYFNSGRMWRASPSVKWCTVNPSAFSLM